MKKLFLGSVALGLLVGSPLSFKFNSSSENVSLADYFSESGLDSSLVSSDDVVGILPTTDKKSLYVFWKNTYPDLISFNVSVSTEKNSSSITGFSEKYQDYNAVYCGAVDSQVYCYSLSVSYSNRIFIRQASGYSSSPFAVGKEFIIDDFGSSINVKSFEKVNVTDKITSFFNVTEGDSDYFTSLFDKNPVLYQEHYIAFNFDVDIDSIVDVTIQSYFDDFIGNTSYLLCDSLNRKWEVDDVYTGFYSNSTIDYSKDYSGNLGKMVFSKSTIDDFKLNLGRSDFLNSPVVSTGSSDFVVKPKQKVFKSDFNGIFSNGSEVYNFNTIMDLKNSDDLKNKLSDCFGKSTASSLGNVLLDSDGKPKYRWFVNYSENKVDYSSYCRSWNYHLGNSAGCSSNQYYCSAGYCLKIDDDTPYKLARQASLIQVTYLKNGITYQKVVCDVPRDSTDDPTQPIVPGSSDDDGLKDWQIAVLVCLALAIVVVLGLVVKPVGEVLNYGFKFFVFVFKIVIDLVYIVLFWWWYSLICKANCKEIPSIWIWKK